MNRRRTVRRNLDFGSVLLLVTAAVVIAAAGVFHAYIKNRQISVSREIQRIEDLISQHELDIKTNDMLLAEQGNRYLIQDRLKEYSSDFCRIPPSAIREVSPWRTGDRRLARSATRNRSLADSSGPAPPREPAVASAHSP